MVSALEAGEHLLLLQATVGDSHTGRIGSYHDFDQTLDHDGAPDKMPHDHGKITIL
jgi:hypothetical protein